MTELPFNTIEFAEAWQDWLEYKEIEHKFNYKSKHSMKAALKKLHRLSGGKEDKAIAIIEESMANGWKGFFNLKETESDKPKTRIEQLARRHGISN